MYQETLTGHASGPVLVWATFWQLQNQDGLLIRPRLFWAIKP